MHSECTVTYLSRRMTHATGHFAVVFVFALTFPSPLINEARCLCLCSRCTNVTASLLINRFLSPLIFFFLWTNPR